MKKEAKYIGMFIPNFPAASIKKACRKTWVSLQAGLDAV